VRRRIDGIHRGARRRRRTLLAAILSIGALGIFAISALAVHDDGIFELEGNAVNDAAVAGEDWNLVCPPNTPQGIAPGCLGGTTAPASTFDIDPDGQTIFTGGGSKDDLNVTQWRHTAGSVPDKDELLHGFAAQYANGFLYFGADRFAANGDAQIGFWFFQSTVTPGPGGIFVDENGDPAQHQNGDVLVLSDFTKGGGQPTIRVFEWHSPGGAINGTLDQIGGTTATPATCGLQANDNFCAIVNATRQDSPWAFQEKGGNNPNTFGPGELYEGGVDLNFLGLADECFSSFLAETRSSQSVDAVLKDFVGGQFAVCDASITTQVSDDEFGIGGSVTDSATVTGAGAGANPPAPTGTVDFYVCGPGVTSCSDPDGTLVSTETLDGTSNPSTVNSDSFTPTEAGTYCFRAHYSGDENYDPADDDGANECFTVNPAQPAIVTNASSGSGLLGATISDTATLSGTVNQANGDPAGGTIVFSLYGPTDSTTDCSTLITTFEVPVSGDGTYGGILGGVSFVPTAPGTYNWVAAYTPADGDANNLPVSGACGDANEASIISQVPSDIATDQSVYPNDSATITASVDDLDGDVVFTLYGSLADCQGDTNALFTQTRTLTDANSGATVSTNNTSAAVSADSTVYWRVTYAGDTEHVGSDSTCEESTALDFTDDVP